MEIKIVTHACRKRKCEFDLTYRLTLSGRLALRRVVDLKVTGIHQIEIIRKVLVIN